MELTSPGLALQAILAAKMLFSIYAEVQSGKRSGIARLVIGILFFLIGG